MDYGFDFADHGVITPNSSKVSAPENDARNRAIEASELAAWAAKPNTFGGYVKIKTNSEYGNMNKFTTWPGSELGTVKVTSTWRTSSRHLGMLTWHAIKVYGNNDQVYHGRYCVDTGQYCRIRACKTRKLTTS